MIKPEREWAAGWFEKPKSLYLSGEWREGRGKSLRSSNPATGEALCDFATASAEDVQDAAAGARRCFEKKLWHRQPTRQRAAQLREIGQLVRDHAAEFATLETLANGKLFRESVEDDLPDAGDIFDYYAGWIDKHYAHNCPVEDGFLNYTVNEPVGVCGLIVPWNFPLLMATWKLAPALAMGNSVVIKPSEYTPWTLLRLVELIDEKLDLPPGLFNLVLGGTETGQAMTSSRLIDKVSFTGSTAVGRDILGQSAQSNLKRVTLEMGGKSPDIIFDDVDDWSAAVDRTFAVMFSQKGEKCSEPTRLLVQEGIYDRVVERLVQKAEAIRCGDPFAASSDQGAQCNREQFDKILGYIEKGKAEGQKLVAGGTRDETGDNTRGLFIRPTIFSEVDPDSTIAQEEIFGPVLSVIPFKTEQEAVAIANGTSYGLAAGVWTGDVGRGHRMAQEIDAGMVFINHYGCYHFSSPFGGFRQSGWGKEMAIHSLASYTKTKSIWLKVPQA